MWAGLWPGSLKRDRGQISIFQVAQRELGSDLDFPGSDSVRVGKSRSDPDGPGFATRFPVMRTG
jgi:hypothetical protein